MMNKLSWFVVFGLILLLLGGVFVVMVFGVRNRVDTKVNGYKFEILDKEKRTILKSENDHLNIVILRMKNPGIENDGNFSFQLLDNGGGKVREITFKGMNIGDPGDMRFQFDPIPDSEGNEYQIVVTADDALPMVSIDVESGGEMSYTSYYRTLNKPQAARSFVQMLKSRILASLGFFSLWTLVLLGIVIYELKSRQN